MIIVDGDVAYDIVGSYMMRIFLDNDVNSLYVERNRVNDFNECHLYSI